MERRSPQLPADPAACRELILALQKQNADLERQRAKLVRQLDEQRHELDQQRRVLDDTAVSYDELRQQYERLQDELALCRRWIHGPRRERLPDASGQGHLFELPQPAADASPGAPAE
jgi:chromosome segregation ATPase